MAIAFVTSGIFVTVTSMTTLVPADPCTQASRVPSVSVCPADCPDGVFPVVFMSSENLSALFPAACEPTAKVSISTPARTSVVREPMASGRFLMLLPSFTRALK
jgi:hypothetical protein